MKKKIVIDKAQLKRMVSAGLRREKISKILGCSLAEIRKQCPGVIPTGRPLREITEDDYTQVQKLAETGNTFEDMKYLLCVAQTTFDRMRKDERFSEAIKKGRAVMRDNLRVSQHREANTGNPTLLIWLGKNELNQTDKGFTKDDSKESPKFNAERILETCEEI